MANEEVAGWLEKAEQDLASAHVLAAEEAGLWEPACFHCQQAVEKVLKAFLVSRTVRFEKVHSISYLLDLCEREEPAFANIRDGAEVLAPYAVDVRYPGFGRRISAEESRTAVENADAVWDFVIRYFQR